MKVSVFGLGYVGCVTAACFARDGHTVLGVDVSPAKVAEINAGRAPFFEPGLDALTKAGVAAGRLSATGSAADAVNATDVALICVGTPSLPDGAQNLDYVRRVCQEIGESLGKREAGRFFTVIVRSTLLPGIFEEVILPVLEKASGKKAGVDFGLVQNPEFLREGTSIADFDNPPFTVIGELNATSGDEAARLYANLNAPLFRVTPGAAAMVKYACNAFHAVKVSFANEIGNLCKSAGVDSHDVMKVFIEDTKLNLSSYYLKPGFAFGGSCLPKDIRALQAVARLNGLDVPVLDGTLESNRRQVEMAAGRILRTGAGTVGLLGLTFKAGTDDLRESPQVELAASLIARGRSLLIYDPNVQLSHIVGLNREYLQSRIPRIAEILCPSPDRLIAECGVLVVGNKTPEYQAALENTRPEQTVVDLVRLVQDPAALNAAYDGLCW
jgi:GDP-mannose 6-dehydrogenase